ncbi:DMT family transporter [Shimia sp. MMG029]|uniref:DMT family transporter n=1 Tax=Shimia sp. MMG029 TaxID=3021978 RepID=UPI0022FDF823|nr:DMT family transporter [Shimia sp. MMG029]MDA5556089.1 DMT family transporter [Shimia sp. MMG029]
MTAPVQKSLSPRAWAELFVLAALWGAVFFTNRIALNEIGPITLVAHRTFWAALLLWALILMRGITFPKGARLWGAFLIMGLLNNLIPFSLLNFAQLTIESGLASIFNAATAFFGVLLAALFLPDERLTWAKALGVAIGFLGVATAIGLNHLITFDPRSLAQIAALLATLSYGFAGIWARKHLAGCSPTVAAAGMLTCSALMSLPLAHVVEAPLSLQLTASTWASIAYGAALGTAGAYLLYYRLLAAAGSGNLLLVTLLVPPFAILLGTFFLGETLHPRAFAGFALLALGLLVLDGRLWHRLRARPSRI